MPLQEKILGAALGEDLVLHSSLCRRQAGAFQQAVRPLAHQVAGAEQPVGAAGLARDAAAVGPQPQAHVGAGHDQLDPD